MNKIVCLLLMGSFVIASDYGYNGSTTATVILAGGIIKAKHIDTEKKYPRKDCPVCKGKGWYISGDGIEKVSCGYCEPDNDQESQVVHPPVKLNADCQTKVKHK